MAAWTYESTGSVASSSTGAALSPGLPAGTTAGDLLLLFTGQRVTGASGPGSISGWTLLNSRGYSGQGLDLWARIATGSGDAPSVDWDGTNFAFAWIERYSGGGYTDLSTIVAHSALDSGSAGTLLLPALTPASVADCLVVGFAIKNNNATDATTISHTILTKRTQLVSTGASRLHAASGSLQQTTAADYDGTNFTIDGTSETLASAGMIVYLRTASTLLYVKLLAEAAAASQTGIEGVVLNATRDTVIGEFSGQAFEADLEDGEAVLLIAASDITPDGGTLTTSDTPIVFAYNATDSLVGPASATVIEV